MTRRDWLFIVGQTALAQGRPEPPDPQRRIGQIIRAYEEYDVAHPQRGPNAGGGANGKTEARSREPVKDPSRETQQG